MIRLIVAMQKQGERGPKLACVIIVLIEVNHLLFIGKFYGAPNNSTNQGEWFLGLIPRPSPQRLYSNMLQSERNDVCGILVLTPFI